MIKFETARYFTQKNSPIKKKTITSKEHRYIKNERVGFYVVDMNYENWKWKELQRKIKPRHVRFRRQVSPFAMTITKKVRVSLI